MMFRALMSGVSFAALCAAATAADLPTRTNASAPYLSPATSFNWTGLYAGVHGAGSYDLSKARATYQPYVMSSGGAPVANYGQGGSGAFGLFNNPPAGSVPFASEMYLAPLFYGGITSGSGGFTTIPSMPSAPTVFNNGRGMVGYGAELGYNHQIGSLVVGAAVDITMFNRARKNTWSSRGDYGAVGTDSGSGSSGGYVDQYTYAAAHEISGLTQVSTEWLGTARLKAGFAQDRFLVYATGGLAFGRVAMRSSMQSNDVALVSCTRISGSGDCGADGSLGSEASWAASNSAVRTGFAVGAGLEYAVSKNFSIKAEGLYYDLGRTRLTVPGTGSYSYDDFLGGSAGSGSGPVSPYTVEKKNNGVVLKVGINGRL